MASSMSFWCLYLIRTDFTHCSGIPIVDFEQVNVVWVEKTLVSAKNYCFLNKKAVQNFYYNRHLSRYKTLLCPLMLPEHPMQLLSDRTHFLLFLFEARE